MSTVRPEPFRAGAWVGHGRRLARRSVVGFALSGVTLAVAFVVALCLPVHAHLSSAAWREVASRSSVECGTVLLERQPAVPWVAIGVSIGSDQPVPANPYQDCAAAHRRARSVVAGIGALAVVLLLMGLLPRRGHWGRSVGGSPDGARPAPALTVDPTGSRQL